MPVLDGEERGGAAGRDADLRVDVLHVVVGGLRRDHEPVGDLAGGQPEGEQPEHLGLAGGQPGRERGPGGTTVAGRGQHPLDRLAVEPAGGAHRPQFGAAASAGASAARCGRSEVIAW